MKLLSKALLYYHTIRHLRLVQVKYQVWYKVKKVFSSGRSYKGHFIQASPISLSFSSVDLILSSGKLLGENRFCFLNIEHKFPGKIDWNITDYGKLWQYNLQYFDFLFDDKIELAVRLDTVNQFLQSFEKKSVTLEPYPVSLRIINWILFSSRYQFNSAEFEECLKAQIHYLENNLEYHILGNHLLENYLALTFAALWLGDENLLIKASSRLESELSEQILGDGGHYEASPMYHQIILNRLLLLIECSSVAKGPKLSFLENVRSITTRMLGWLQQMQVNDDTYPQFGDATSGIVPSPSRAFEAARKLGIKTKQVTLSDSGYRRYNGHNYVLFLDVGNIIPAYQPGHAHADALSFSLYYKYQPIIIDPGISTYNNCTQRQLERSTYYHNTVTVNRKNQSQVWSAFRVAKRAKCSVIKEENMSLIATHDGYKHEGIVHRRALYWEENKVLLKDSTGHPTKGCEAHFHFNWSLSDDIELIGNTLFLKGNTITITFENYDSINFDSYKQALGYNRLQDARMVSVAFRKELITLIQFN